MLKNNDSPPCGWCTKSLSNDRATKYKTLLEDYDTVIPNCGSQQCLHMATRVTERADGYQLKGKGKKNRAQKRKALKDAKEQAKRRRLNEPS